MEFERRTKRGKALAQMVERQEGKDEMAEATKSSEALRAGIQARSDVREEQSSQSNQEAEGLSTADRGTAQADEPIIIDPKLLHNLGKARAFIADGDELSAIQLPLRLASIRIEGAKGMRPSFLARLCRPYVDPSLQPNALNRLIYSHRLQHVLPGQPTTLPALLNLLSSVGSDLASLDVFADLAASLEPSVKLAESPAALAAAGGLASTALLSSVEDVDLILNCKEKPRFFIKSSTDVGNGEGNAAIQAQVRNLFGGAETADLSATIGTRTRRAFSGSLNWPVFALPDHWMSLRAYAQDRDLSGYASATEGARGVRLGARINSGMGAGIHEVAYELAHRHIGRLQPTASISMRRLAGHSIKSSILHNWTLDTRDDPIIATRGSLLKTALEYAGLGGDANHIKAEVEAQVSRCLGTTDGFGWSLGGNAGFLASVNGRSPPFSDRFQLGGPTSVRMFRFNSLGPKDGLDSLGGDAFYSWGASFFTPVWPGKSHWPLRWHAFANAGQLIQLDHRGANTLGPAASTLSSWAARNGSRLVDDLITKPSCSAGVGLMLRQGNIRAELNIGVPIAIRKGDGYRKGVQLGIGIDFL